MKSFQAILLIVFGALTLLAVFIFATFSAGSQNSVGKVEIWGTLPKPAIDGLLKEVKASSDDLNGVSYREIDERAFIGTLIEAIAANRGPDLIVFPAEDVVSESDKVLPVSYRTLSKRAFQDSFIEAGEVFLTDTGILGIPFYIDPFVLYWNRTLFSGAGVARPPRFWDEFTDIAPRISKASENGTLTRSALSLGEWENVRYAKEILISLIKGLGNEVVARSADGTLSAVLDEKGTASAPPAESALRFYTDFADPVKQVYSWNRAQPESYAAFIAGSLGVYLGRASEASQLRAANPNLNFDLASYPRVRDGQIAVPAKLFALAVPRGAANASGALQTALALSGKDAQELMARQSGLPSVRRDVLANNPQNPYETIFRDAALSAYSFYDPNPTATSALFRRMVEDVSSGKLRISEAVRSGQSELSALLR